MRSIVSRISVCIVSIVFISGCVTLSPFAVRQDAADKIAALNGFEKSYIKTDHFILASYHRFKDPNKPLHIYIEGDGAAWITHTRLSDNPTPRNPLVLELAALDPADNVAYLARPGQYSSFGKPDCDPSYWSNRRFSEEVITSMNQATDYLCRKSGSRKVSLIGYSGGAAIAIIVASRRNDIIELRTIAGNLDCEAVNRYHKVTSLEGSLNPIDFASSIAKIPQRNFVGSKDRIIPSFIAASFVEKSGSKNKERITIVKGATHTTGWREKWPKLLSLLVD